MRNFEITKRVVLASISIIAVYGTLEALDPVSYPEIDGSYMYVEKIKKLYTMHTRTVAHMDANGNTTYTIETYWSWDYAGEESKAASTVSFCEATFPNLNYPERDTLIPYTNPVMFGMNTMASVSHIQEPSLQPFLTTLSLIVVHFMRI